MKNELGMDDAQVQSTLKALGYEAFITPEETANSRAQRLREILENESSESVESEKIISNPALLLQARHSLAEYSLTQAKTRLAKEKTQKEENLSYKFSAIGSMYCEDRLPMALSIDNTTNTVAIAGWSGICSVFDKTTANLLFKLKGHQDKVQSVDTSQGLILTGSFDASIRLWKNEASEREGAEFQETVYVGHESRVNSVKFCGLMAYFLSCSHDMTWKMWDLERQVSILTQTGHNRGIYSMSVHPDSSLTATGDLSGIGAVWDLRTGALVLTLKGHLKQVLACTFAQNGFNVLTGSDDNTIKVWDLRRKGMLYSIPAHTKLVSSIDSKHNIFASSSYDGFIKVWKLHTFELVETIANNDKVTDVAIDFESKSIFSTSFDRTFKIWAMSSE